MYISDSIGGQLRGDNLKPECPFSGVTNSGRVLEEGAGKQGLEFVSDGQ